MWLEEVADFLFYFLAPWHNTGVLVRLFALSCCMQFRDSWLLDPLLSSYFALNCSSFLLPKDRLGGRSNPARNHTRYPIRRIFNNTFLMAFICYLPMLT
ncbi:uncharacterized protein BP01DRAFT_143221 [Aspergillus saccharolyticus JOP 1030-1]|uniref:Uncharacterized protein n=1 Tax=Aspergillus saccharolyticus JOP 1030-1 TaxID=1450539 RepID=A0A318Z3X8_9EURO|nr:hypothetical protein BP01DRAFT_143221 [Aspergillus saccharolyticus JOP 1030-1]PYH42015.1 hypothetical protein BP01DRAFT_143221 [Aspergillus saccharolyticus JOP 1030-1]